MICNALSTNPLKAHFSHSTFKRSRLLAKTFAFFCFLLPKIYLKFTLLELCQQFSQLSFIDSCDSLRKSTQFSVSPASLTQTQTGPSVLLSNLSRSLSLTPSQNQSDWKSELFPSHLVAHHSVCKILKVSEFEIFGLFF